MPGTSLQDLIENHGAMDIVAALGMYLRQYVPHCQITPSKFDRVDIYTRLYIDLQSPQRLDDGIQKDIIRACPASHSPRKKSLVPAHFDTALIHDTRDAEDIGLKGYRAARIRAIFRLPHWFECSDTLAYIERFTNFTLPVEPPRMSQVSYSMRHNRRYGEIVHVNSITRSCHLTPKFGSAKHRNQTWTSENVLDECPTFFLNSQLSVYMFQMCDGLAMRTDMRSIREPYVLVNYQVRPSPPNHLRHAGKKVAQRANQWDRRERRAERIPCASDCSTLTITNSSGQFGNQVEWHVVDATGNPVRGDVGELVTGEVVKVSQGVRTDSSTLQITQSFAELDVATSTDRGVHTKSSSNGGQKAGKVEVDTTVLPETCVQEYFTGEIVQDTGRQEITETSTRRSSEIVNASCYDLLGVMASARS
ncbi:hypothetical protein JB92DRAFT_2834352 [Gautieria morchelliformis]|nr:hypothetical protein JB92DRAFT_2834352 [Gautieria morchelliformis]